MSDKATTTIRLGKGIEALIPKTFLASGKTIVNLPLSQVKPNPYQPRSRFNPESIDSLANSIKTHGLTQPIIVRRTHDHYELIAGERRLRACQVAELEFIPAIIKNVSDRESMELALIENLQREDLNPIEVAVGFQQLLHEFSLTHQQLGDIFGKSRSAITNTLRLLNLPDQLKEAVLDGQISEGHARCLLGLNNTDLMIPCCKKIIKEALSVRAAERLVSAVNSKNQKSIPPTGKDAQSETLALIEKSILKRLQQITKLSGVKITGNHKKGQVVLKYASLDEFHNILHLFGVLPHLRK